MATPTDKQAAALLSGCVGVFLYLFVQMPLWAILLYVLLDAVHAAPWVWVIYWIYLPVGVLTAFITRLVQTLAE